MRYRSSLAAGVLTALVAACSASPTTTSRPPSPDDSSTSSIGATPTAAESASPPTADNAFLQVVSDELRIRAAAGTGAELVGTLANGSIVRVESGPTQADGFAWLEVTDVAGRRGWAADGDATDVWLAPVPEATSGTPILTLRYGCEVVAPINPPATTVMDDGWVLTTRREASGGWIARRLSTGGLDDIREDVIGSPYLQSSGSYEPQRLPGAEPPGHGACLYTFTIPRGGEPVVVESINWFGDEEEGAFYQASPERRALDGIARNLIEIDAVLGDGAWEGPGLPYLATEYVIELGDGTGPAPDGSPSVDPASLGLGDLDEFGAARGEGRCGVVSRAEAFEFARVINAEVPNSVRLDIPSYPSFRTDDGWISANIAPRFPGGETDCESRG